MASSVTHNVENVNIFFTKVSTKFRKVLNMRCDTFLGRLQNLTGFGPDINLLEKVSKTAKKTWYARMSRNENVPEEEIALF